VRVLGVLIGPALGLLDPRRELCDLLGWTMASRVWQPGPSGLIRAARSATAASWVKIAPLSSCRPGQANSPMNVYGSVFCRPAKAADVRDTRPTPRCPSKWGNPKPAHGARYFGLLNNSNTEPTPREAARGSPRRGPTPKRHTTFAEDLRSWSGETGFRRNGFV
jgi:hypothetical protein